MHKEKIELLEKRVNVFYRWLQDRIIVKNVPLEVEYYSTKLPVPFNQRLEGDYKQIKEGEHWGNEWESAWFHFTGEIPIEWQGHDVAARLEFGGEALVFENSGCPIYGLTHGSVFDAAYREVDLD